VSSNHCKGGEKKLHKNQKTGCSSLCLMVLKSSPLHHVLAGFGAAVVPHQGSFPRPISLSSLCLAHTLGQEPSPTAGARPALRRIPSASPSQPRRHPQAEKDAQRPQPPAPRTDGLQGSPATFDKVEVRVHFIRSIDRNVELQEEEKLGVETSPRQHPGAALGAAREGVRPQATPRNVVRAETTVMPA